MNPEDSRGPVRMEKMIWPEFKEKVDSSIVFLPVGSAEQHGPHMPFNVDTVIAEEFAVQAAKECDGIVAPPVHYGYRSQTKSGGGQKFDGTTNLSGQTLQLLVRDVISDLVSDGAQNVVIVNGHYENEYFIREAIDLHLDAGGAGEFMIISWWELITDEVMDDVFSDIPGGFPGWAAEHAGIMETALMLHFEPDLVRTDNITDDEASRAPPYIMKPAPEEFIPESGSFYKATHSTPKMGERVAEDVVQAMIEAFETEW